MTSGVDRQIEVAKRGADELTLETDAQSLSHPMAMVHLRHLSHPSKDRRA